MWNEKIHMVKIVFLNLSDAINSLRGGMKFAQVVDCDSGTLWKFGWRVLLATSIEKKSCSVFFFRDFVVFESSLEQLLDLRQNLNFSQFSV